MRLLINWVISSIAVFITSYLLPGVHIDSLGTAFIVALVLGVINAVVKPILFILTLPITILTLGIFALILNVFMILLTDNLVSGFSVDGFLWAVLFGLVLSLVSSILHSFVKE